MRFVLPLILLAAVSGSCEAPASSSTPATRNHRNEPEISWFSSRDEELARRGQLLATELEETLEVLPHVESARIHLTLAAPALGRVAAPTGAHAAVLLTSARPESIDRNQAALILTAAVPDLSPNDLEIITSPIDAPPSPLTVRIGPLEVTQRSATVARTVIGALLVLALLQAILLLLAGLRIRRFRRELHGDRSASNCN